MPSPIVNGIFLFCLAVAAKLTKVELHAVCVMSNHMHLVATDVEGRLPEFMAWLNRHTAVCIKLLRKRAGPMWEAGEKYSAVALTTPLAVYKKLVYTLLNPVKAGLVAAHDLWPGLCLGHEQWQGAGLETERPTLFFRRRAERSPMLRLNVPPALAHHDPEALLDSLRRCVASREQAIGRELAAANRRLLGAKAVRRQRPYDRPAKNNPPGTRNPVFSAVAPAAIRTAARELRQWRDAYRCCYEQLKAGVRDVVFPAGTWWMVRYGGVLAAQA